MDWAVGLTSLGPYVDMFGGLLYAVLAAWVLSIRPRSPATITFAVFGLSMGVYFVLSNAYNVGWIRFGVSQYVLASLAVPAFVAAGALAAAFPASSKAPERRVVVAASLTALGLLLVFAAVSWFDFLRRGGSDTLRDGGAGFGAWAETLLLGYHSVWLTSAYWLLLIAWAWRFPLFDSAREQHWQRQVQTVSAALIIYHGLLAGVMLAELADYFRNYASPEPRWPNTLDTILHRATPAVVMLIVAAKWLMNMGSARAADRLRCRTLAWLALALMFSGMAGRLLLGPGFTDMGVMGVTRAAGVLMIVYSLLRERLFDLDVRFRFAIRSSTLAGLFAGLVFVLAEVLETLFSIGSVAGSVTAAAAIAVALRPLQRVAARVAEAVLPVAEAGEQADVARQKIEAYLHALQGARRDGRVSAREEVLLADLAEALGLSGSEVKRLRAGSSQNP